MKIELRVSRALELHFFFFFFGGGGGGGGFSPFVFVCVVVVFGGISPLCMCSFHPHFLLQFTHYSGVCFSSCLTIALFMCEVHCVEYNPFGYNPIYLLSIRYDPLYFGILQSLCRLT